MTAAPKATFITDVRAGIATNLATIQDVQVSAHMLGSPTPPYLEVFPESVEYDASMRRGSDTATFVVRAFVGQTTDEGSQRQLDAMLAPSGATSVKAAVESDRTLGGIVNDLRVTKASGYRVYAFPGRPDTLGCEWTIEIDAPGA